MLPRFTISLESNSFKQLLSANKKYLMVKNQIKFKVPGVLVVNEVLKKSGIATGQQARFVITGVEPISDVLLHEYVFVYLVPEIQLI